MKKIYKILIGTHNKGKFKELSFLLPKKIKKLSPNKLGIKSPKEDGKTFKENSEIKAKYFFSKSKLNSISDDSGICINYLKGNIYELIKGFKNNYFDIVCCTHVIEHLETPFEIIKEIRRVSKREIILICPLEKEYKWGMNYHINFFPNSFSK